MRFQLALPFDQIAEPPPTKVEVSRTRALVDAITSHLPHARVVLTDNRTVLLSQTEKDGVRIVRVHQMFLDAPEHVRHAVAHYVARGDKTSGAVVDTFVDAQQHLLHGSARPLKDDAHLGRTHNLWPIFVELNARFFDNKIEAEIGWGRAGVRPRKRRRHSITFGSWDSRAKRIVIHPVLDQPHVPSLAVERVVHHEMLHAKHGEMRDAHGRRVVHGKAFRAEEAQFPGAKEADAWFDKNLDALLRWKP
jgi:hypothetical protein